MDEEWWRWTFCRSLTGNFPQFFIPPKMSIATQKITAWNPAGTPTESCSQAKAPWAMTWATHFAACSVPSSATSSCCNLAGQEQSQCQASQDTTLVYSYSNQVDIVEWMMLNGSANQLTSASGFLIFTLDVHTKFIPLRKTRFRGNASFQSRTLPAGRRFQSPRRSHFLGCTSSLCVINLKKNHISFWDNDARKKKQSWLARSGRCLPNETEVLLGSQLGIRRQKLFHSCCHLRGDVW